ncbi:MAG: protein-disulfide reductase DsbD family protein [Flavisolibacter sp.]
MKKIGFCFFVFLFFSSQLTAKAQDSVKLFRWNVSSKRISPNTYQLVFSTPGNGEWNLYAPNQDLSGVSSASLTLNDSAFHVVGDFQQSGAVKTGASKIFTGIKERVYNGPTSWTEEIKIDGPVPGSLQGSLVYNYAKGEEFYQGEFPFTVSLEGGVSKVSAIKVASIDVKHPINDCGDEETGNKSMLTVFLIGFGAGLLALLFPCVFPLIPLTVSFFTKRAKSKRQGVSNAILYGASIFLIYTLISLPFHILNVSPEVLNNISTNVSLNIVFFIVFVVFAISFFGYFEITLPSSFANKADSRAGLGNFLGIFFMALTLAIVSFSCTSGILGALLVGALSGSNGAWQLTSGMAGFGLGLGLPFILFALFPNWLQSLPKSGGWMNELKAVFGFIELAMAFKFLSNADLVKQWHLLEREIFIGSWIVIGLAIVLYLLGVIRFSGDNKPKFTKARIFFIVVFSVITIYLVPGLTNTKYADLRLISGFPPPFNYSAYKPSVNYQDGVKPLQNDYEKALQLAKQQNKPVLIDFTGWACVNCRRMEENVWVDEKVKQLMTNDFIVVSLYVDERRKLPVAERMDYKTSDSTTKSIVTVGDKWATFQAENFYAVSQPQYAIISPDQIALTKTKAYTQSAAKFADWLKCGLDAYKKHQGK